MAYVFENSGGGEWIDVPIDPDSDRPVIRQDPGNWGQVMATEERLRTDRRLSTLRREVIHTLKALAVGDEAVTVLGALMDGRRDLYEISAHCKRLPQDVWFDLTILQSLGIVTQDFDEETPNESFYSLHPNP